MPYEIRWYNEDEDILYMRYNRQWTWEDVYRADAQARDMYRTKHGRVDCICIMNRVRFLPADYAANVSRIASEPYPNLHMVVFVAERFFHDLLSAYNDILAKLEHDKYNRLPYKIGFAGTEEEAFDLILESRRRDNLN